jgi:hypothetical protein
MRETIAWRGTVRMGLLPITMLGWAAVWAALLTTRGVSVSGAIPLLVLVAGFEGIHALHVGVERIGRYLQVFFEDGRDGPRWESTVMRLGPGLPGAGVDPLFTPVFALAAVANLLLPFVRGPWPDTTILAGMTAIHGAFLVRLARARRAASRQRAVDLETFGAVRVQLLGMAPQTPHATGDPTV